MSSGALRRAFLAPALRQPILSQTAMRYVPHARTITTVAEASFWKSLVPKPLRSKTAAGGKKTQKEWNPATFFIFIFLLIGSMSIQMIALKKDFATFMRQSDVRIGLLREVVEKLQRGEEVDVEKVLGTGDPEKELEWEDVLREIEREEPAMSQRKKQSEPTPAPAPKEDASPAPKAVRAQQSTLASKGFF
ncbi:hypothetical protein VTI74DRAFT_7819 [Chaetomium olivicolor]